ncbi:hypothetical protein ACJJTC_004700 [Scirpophaga incertulas]
MSLFNKSWRSLRPLFTSRGYCEKSIYQKHEEGEKPRLVYGKEYPEWRKPWIKRKGEFTSKLGLFVEKNPNPDILNMLSKAPNLTVAKIKKWWSEMKDLQEIENQKYLPERVAALGFNLAAVQFFVYRSCSVRLKDSQDWIKGDITTLKLPTTFVEGYLVEAIDCSTFYRGGIRYEGLENIGNLPFLKWLSLRNGKHIDIWCVNRVASLAGETLEYLDLSGCNLCSNCVFALARMHKLRILVITDPGDNLEMQTALSLLEEENPQLMLKTIQE